jgi:hypothetical protein
VIGYLQISNILSEHVAKSIAVARKNFLFVNTQSGATAAAKIYSMGPNGRAKRLGTDRLSHGRTYEDTEHQRQ